jgi:hypothetical protein
MDTSKILTIEKKVEWRHVEKKKVFKSANMIWKKAA